MKRTVAPLRGVRAVELGTYVAAPALGFMLSLLGAEVIKVEPTEGDITRKLTPWSWVNYNSLKKSICIDLKKKEGLRVFEDLAKRSDIMIDGLGPGVAERLGVGFGRLHALNKGLLYCSIKGLSSRGPNANRAAFDTVAQAEAGLMYVTIPSDSSKPARVGNPCVDLTASALALINLLAAPLEKSREYNYIEIPLFDVVAFWNSYWFPYVQMCGEQPSGLGSRHPGFSPYSIYRCSDGHVFIGDT